MSTKIHNAFKVKLPSKEFGQVLNFAKNTLKPVFLQAMKLEMVGVFNKGPDDYKANWSKNDDLNRECKSKKRWSHLDFGMHVIFFDVGLENELLMVAYPGNNRTVAAFSTIEGVSDYDYWDNVDQPDGVTDAEWKQREDHWDIALGTTDIPAQEGFGITLYDEYSLPFPGEFSQWWNEVHPNGGV